MTDHTLAFWLTLWIVLWMVMVLYYLHRILRRLWAVLYGLGRIADLLNPHPRVGDDDDV